jgi:hypothetical protein
MSIAEPDAPAFVEVGETGIAVDHPMRLSLRFNVLDGALLGQHEH